MLGRIVYCPTELEINRLRAIKEDLNSRNEEKCTMNDIVVICIRHLISYDNNEPLLHNTPVVGGKIKERVIYLQDWLKGLLLNYCKQNFRKVSNAIRYAINLYFEDFYLTD